MTEMAVWLNRLFASQRRPRVPALFSKPNTIVFFRSVEVQRWRVTNFGHFTTAGQFGLRSAVPGVSRIFPFRRRRIWLCSCAMRALRVDSTIPFSFRTTRVSVFAMRVFVPDAMLFVMDVWSSFNLSRGVGGKITTGVLVRFQGRFDERHEIVRSMRLSTTLGQLIDISQWRAAMGSKACSARLNDLSIVLALRTLRGALADRLKEQGAEALPIAPRKI